MALPAYAGALAWVSVDTPAAEGSTADALADAADEFGPWKPFSEDTWSVQVYGSASFADEAGEMYTMHVGVGYYIWDNFSINLEALGGYINIEDGSDSGAAVVGLDLLIRYHIVKEPGWSFYFDGGGGLQQSSEPFPGDGTHFNFRPMAGLGFTFSLDDEDHAMLMVGARWIHVSNARKDGQARNPGYDSAQVYMGMMFAF